MEMNNHQNVPLNQASANSQPSKAPVRQSAQRPSCHASTASASTCSHQIGCPALNPTKSENGHAMLIAWTRPAINVIADWSQAGDRDRLGGGAAGAAVQVLTNRSSGPPATPGTT